MSVLDCFAGHENPLENSVRRPKNSPYLFEERAELEEDRELEEEAVATTVEQEEDQELGEETVEEKGQAVSAEIREEDPERFRKV